MSKIDKQKEIEKEKAKLKKIFKNIAEDKKILCDKLITNAAFMAVALEELQEDIMENGTTIIATNGNGFDVLQENPAQKSYNTMISRYSSVIKQLQDLLPDQKQDGINQAGETLASFVGKGKAIELR